MRMMAMVTTRVVFLMRARDVILVHMRVVLLRVVGSVDAAAAVTWRCVDRSHWSTC